MCAEATVTNRDWKEIENELNGLVPGLPQGEKRRRQITAFAKRSKRTKRLFWRTSLTLWFKRKILSSISGLELALRRSCFPYDLCRFAHGALN